jgi:hypothetical protein
LAQDAARTLVLVHQELQWLRDSLELPGY